MKVSIVFSLGFLGLAALADAQPAPSGPRFQVDRNAGPYPLVFAVAAGPPGGFTVAWKASDGLRVGRFDPAGSPPGRGILIRRPGPKVWDVQLAVGEKNGLVVWTESLDDERNGLFGRRLDAVGRPLGNVLRLDAGKRASAGVARVVVDRAGDFVVAWDEATADGSSSTYSLHLRRLSASGSLGPDVRLPSVEPYRYRTVSSLLCDRFGGCRRAAGGARGGFRSLQPRDPAAAGRRFPFALAGRSGPGL